jgi:hypothetical protein
MLGFDEKFSDLPAYTLGITREIWEDRGVGPALKRYYADDVVVRAPSGVQIGNADVTRSTLGTLHEFPDRRLVGEDVIWHGDEEAGFLSSHRLISVMRHTGDGAFGRATGRVVRSRIIADCVIHANQVREEWLVRDQAAFAACLGLSARSLAELQLESDLATRGRAVYFTPAQDVPSHFPARVEPSGSAALCAQIYRRIWTDKELSSIRQGYGEGCTVFAPGGTTLSGHADLDGFLIGYLASFPDARLCMASAFVNRHANAYDRVALRWTVEGTHAGWGHFGRPSGGPVHIMGLTHALVFEGRILMEWLLIDEVSIWKQILAPANTP